MMEYDIFFECVTCFVDKVNTSFRIVRVHLAATAINGQEHRFDTRSSLRHQAGRSRRCYRQTGDITATVFHHVVIQLRIGFTQTVDKRILFFALCIIDIECTTFFGHFHRRTIGCQSQHLLYLLGKLSRFFRAVAQSQGGNHIAFGCDAHTGTTSLQSLLLYLLPQVAFALFYFQ